QTAAIQGTAAEVLFIPKRNERSEQVHSDGIVPRLTPPVRPLIRISAGKARFNTPRLAAERIQLVRGANLREVA
ncbi:MAG: hypothetical protein DRZ90_16550, partial [Spirochaetes bacterium]